MNSQHGDECQRDDNLCFHFAYRNRGQIFFSASGIAISGYQEGPLLSPAIDPNDGGDGWTDCLQVGKF
jgi:hypothetical protein